MFQMQISELCLSCIYCLQYFRFNVKSNIIIKRIWNVK